MDCKQCRSFFCWLSVRFVFQNQSESTTIDGDVMSIMCRTTNNTRRKMKRKQKRCDGISIRTQSLQSSCWVIPITVFVSFCFDEVQLGHLMWCAYYGRRPVTVLSAMIRHGVHEPIDESPIRISTPPNSYLIMGRLSAIIGHSKCIFFIPPINVFNNNCCYCIDWMQSKYVIGTKYEANAFFCRVIRL